MGRLMTVIGRISHNEGVVEGAAKTFGHYACFSAKLRPDVHAFVWLRFQECG